MVNADFPGDFIGDGGELPSSAGPFRPANGVSPAGAVNGAAGVAGGMAGGALLGAVVAGSVSDGVEVRLAPGVPVEEVKVGAFVTIQGRGRRFFGVITDVELASADPRLKYLPPPDGDPFIAGILQGTVAYGAASVLPQLTLPAAPGQNEPPAAAKSVPAHFSPVFTASQSDIELVFGSEEAGNFWIGSPLDMDTRLCLNLGEMVKRSIGVFGKSGTGKSFLTRLLLAGLLQQGEASSLIFDMHNEYGWEGQDTDRNTSVKGLKQLFGARVSTFTLDEEHSRRRGTTPDETVRLGYNHIDPEDIQLLRETLNLTELAAESAFNLQRKWRDSWLQRFLETGESGGLPELAEELAVNPASLRALYNRLERLKRFHFLTPHTGEDAARRMVEHLQRGQHIVLEFGRYRDSLPAYVLVSNLLTRRIHETYVRRKEEASGGRGDEPRPLVIVIEEAHKLLNPEVAAQTIFGVIARELRKYNVTLMVVDQRPSGIEDEVLSQIGTRISCLLDNERDVEAVLAGTPGSRQLRAVLARLEPRQQALVFGHSVPLPVVVHTREYGPALYESLAAYGAPTRAAGLSEVERLEQELNELF